MLRLNHKRTLDVQKNNRQEAQSCQSFKNRQKDERSRRKFRARRNSTVSARNIDNMAPYKNIGRLKYRNMTNWTCGTYFVRMSENTYKQLLKHSEL